MPRPPLPFRLKAQDASTVETLLHGGVQQVRVVLRALALKHLHRGASAPAVARLVPLTAQAIRKIAQRYRAGGLDSALYEQPRPGATPAELETARPELRSCVSRSTRIFLARDDADLSIEDALPDARWTPGILPRVRRRLASIAAME